MKKYKVIFTNEKRETFEGLLKGNRESVEIQAANMLKGLSGKIKTEFVLL